MPIVQNQPVSPPAQTSIIIDARHAAQTSTVSRLTLPGSPRFKQTHSGAQMYTLTFDSSLLAAGYTNAMSKVSIFRLFDSANRISSFQPPESSSLSNCSDFSGSRAACWNETESVASANHAHLYEMRACVRATARLTRKWKRRTPKITHSIPVGFLFCSLRLSPSLAPKVDTSSCLIASEKCLCYLTV